MSTFPRKCVLFLFLVFATSLLAQEAANDSTTAVSNKKERRLTLHGRVYDSFTKAALKAHMTLMNADSTVVDTMTCWQWTWGTADSYYQFRIPRRQGRYIIKAQLDGYEDTFVDFNVRYIGRNTEFEVPRHLMKKRADDGIFAEDELEGVTIRGTRVKIAYRGDTIVYNASAFNLPEGSMLDGLIRQMPGAELKDNGDIYVNGVKVDYLTLNGNDFFKGNNKVMLDNLPYYTVQNVEVYHKESEKSQWKGRNVERKDYVMDVKLKREYNRGLLMNAEAGAGSMHRWMARMFALYYTDHTRLSMFANANNVNENRRPGQQGEWTPANMPQGLRTTKQIGMNLTSEDADKNVQENFSAQVTWSKNENESRSLSERFSSDGNITSGSQSFSLQDDFRMSMTNHLRLKAPIKLWSYSTLSFTNGDMHSQQQDSTLREVIINRTMNAGLNKYRRFSFNTNNFWTKKLPWGDELEIGLTAAYGNNKPSKAYSISHTEYAQTGEEDLRNRYHDTHSNSYSYQMSAQYSVNFMEHWSFETAAVYSQQFQHSHNYNYRLDWLGNVTMPTGATTDSPYPTQALKQIGWLPSNDLLMQVLDAPNSDTHGNWTRTYTLKPALNYFNEDRDEQLLIALPMERKNEKMHFIDDEYDTIAHRSLKTFLPSISYYRWGKSGYTWAEYSMSTDQPDFASLIPSDDSTNPLVLVLNNPRLKNRHTHTGRMHITFKNDSTGQIVNVGASASVVRNATGTRTTYEPQTGKYTYMQDNVDGNWNAYLNLNYSRPLDKMKRLRLQTDIGTDFAHSVDFDITESVEETKLSRVDTWSPEGSLSLEYQIDKLTLGINGSAKWQRSTSSRENFERISAWDYKYGMNATYTIPVLDITVASDINMFQRRGYNTAQMNTSDLVWNALLSRSLFKGKCVVKLTAFDLLHRISSKQYVVNAQGRTETWNNCLPRYAMLTLSYKFQKMPKKK